MQLEHLWWSSLLKNHFILLSVARNICLLVFSKGSEVPDLHPHCAWCCTQAASTSPQIPTAFCLKQQGAERRDWTMRYSNSAVRNISIYSPAGQQPEDCQAFVHVKVWNFNNNSFGDSGRELQKVWGKVEKTARSNPLEMLSGKNICTNQYSARLL